MGKLEGKTMNDRVGRRGTDRRSVGVISAASHGATAGILWMTIALEMSLPIYALLAPIPREDAERED